MALHISYAAAAGRHPYGAPAGRPGGIAIGVAISLVLHAVLLYQSRFGWSPPAPALRAPETITVWLHPEPKAQPLRLQPPAAAEPDLPGKERGQRKPAPARKALPAPAATQQGMTWVAPEPAASSAAADPFAEPAQAAPKFDMEAAKRSARKVAHERDPAKAGTAVGQFPEKPLASETPLARKMSQAARADCKDGIPGGLLAPLLLAMDKKDQGCKW